MFSYNYLEKEITTKNFHKIYLFYGEQPYLVKYYRRKFVASILGGKINNFNFTTIDGGELDLKQLSMCIDSLPIGENLKCVVIENLNPSGLSTKEFKMFLDILDDIPKYCILIISQTLENLDFKKSNKWSKINSTVNRLGIAVNFSNINKKNLCDFLIDLARKNGQNISINVVSRLIDICGTDLNILRNEVIKLCCNNYPKKDIEALTSENINLISRQFNSINIFEICKYLMNGDVQTTLKHIEYLLYQKESEIAILGVIINHYLDIYRVKLFMKYNKSINDLKQNFDYYNKEFRLNLAKNYAKKLAFRQIDRSIKNLLHADLKLKSTSINGKLILQELIVNLIQIFN